MCFWDEHSRARIAASGGTMTKKTKFYLVKEKAVPEVLLKVVEAKRILDAEKMTTVQEATERVGISRSTFYK